MEEAKQLCLPGVSETFMRTADVLLVLDNGVAIPCHSQILSLHSTVLCNMLTDLAASKQNERVKLPLADFTEAQCSALLAYFYSHGVPSKGAAFESHDRAAHDAASAVARFAHVYDAPHALRHVEAYLTAFMEEKRKDGSKISDDFACVRILEWAIMANKFDMHELCGHSEAGHNDQLELFPGQI